MTHTPPRDALVIAGVVALGAAGQASSAPGPNTTGPQAPAPRSRTLTQATTAAPHSSPSGGGRRLGVLNLLHLDLLAHELVNVDHYALLLHIHEDE